MSDIFVKGILGKLFLDNLEASSPSVIALYVALACILPAVVGYLLGSVNSAVIISRLFYHDDIHKYGSGNPGTTNMMRTYGKTAAALTLVGDMSKTALSVFVGALLLAESGMYVAGLFSVIGHMFPVFFGFKGGKGVASTAALVLCTEPLVFLVLLLIFVCIVAATKFLSLGSIMCVMLYPLVLNRMYMLFRHSAGVPFIPTLVSFLIMVLVIARHRDNIRRLLNKEENKFSFKKSVKAGSANTVHINDAEPDRDTPKSDEMPKPKTKKRRR
ncbi:MAG: glycerol-3-phosphate 1-O-acyltransferase PlsY [Clostridia bacterium]|nr:glycerol-3-phosphate 1-O-acyltransferase PlsY [Clostridia bacterium]